MKITFQTKYQWVAVHQDDIKSWARLSLIGQVSVIINRLVKTLITGVVEQEFISSKFPFGCLQVEVDGTKLTGSPRAASEKYWGAELDQKLYHEKHMINEYEFNLVWWDGVQKAMHDLPNIFRVFVTKQTSKLCGTNICLGSFRL